MARTQATDYDQRRQSFVDKAAELFASEGFHKSSISSLAKACGTSEAALYHYFSSKEEILHAVMKGHTDLLYKTATAIAAGDGDGEHKLRELARAFMEIYVASRAQHIVLSNEIGALPDHLRSEIVASENQVVDRILDVISSINPELVSREKYRKPVAMIFMGMINWTYTWYQPGGALSHDLFADLVAEIFLRGLPDIRRQPDPDKRDSGS